MTTKFKSQSGQVAVIVLLIMAGMLTMGLSVATRTTQEALLSGQESQSARVFNAAEQGIEEAMSQDLKALGEFTQGSVTAVDGVDVDYSVTKVDKLQTKLFEGIAIDVDVTGASTGDNLRIDWSKVDDCNTQDPASLIASIYYDDAGTTRVRHVPIGACDKGDGFLRTAQGVLDINQDGYQRRYDLPLQTNDFLVRIKPIYNDTDVNIYSSDASFVLPVQYYKIKSVASNQNGNEQRIVEVNRTLSAAPWIFDYAVFSGNTLTK
jgi:type II secretory pathway pseudopilin PulG